MAPGSMMLGRHIKFIKFMKIKIYEEKKLRRIKIDEEKKLRKMESVKLNIACKR